MLLGISPSESDHTIYQVYACNQHRDSGVVDCDVERSLWSYTEGGWMRWLLACTLGMLFKQKLSANGKLGYNGNTQTRYVKQDSLGAGWVESERTTKRNELRACLNAVVCKSPGEVFYYQGLHDVASVLLFVAGEGASMQMLDKLVNCQLKDCTRSAPNCLWLLLQTSVQHR